jgi:hypothetical protein
VNEEDVHLLTCATPVTPVAAATGTSTKELLARMGYVGANESLM